jgi:uncharacterized membrane protein YhiD involved in acid resistance
MGENTTYKIALFTILIIGIVAVGLSINHSKVNITKAEQSYLELLEKNDSLKNVVDSLQNEIFYLEDGFDHKEHIYEQAIYDCEHRKNHRETLRRLKNEQYR